MCVSGVKCITRLDVSENNLDVELASVVNGVTRNRHLQSLNISKNLPKIKARDVGHVMDAIVQLVQVGTVFQCIQIVLSFWYTNGLNGFNFPSDFSVNRIL